MTWEFKGFCWSIIGVIVAAGYTFFGGPDLSTSLLLFGPIAGLWLVLCVMGIEAASKIALSLVLGSIWVAVAVRMHEIPWPW